MKVLKFGGTSLGSPQKMQHVARLISNDSSAKIVVLSAVAGTTDALVQICQALSDEAKEKATEQLAHLKDTYDIFIKDLYQSEICLKKALKITEEVFGTIMCNIASPYTQISGLKIMAQGEILSTQLFCNYLEEINIKAVWLSAFDFMLIDKAKEPVLSFIEENISKKIEHGDDCQLYVTQGFICKNTEGNTDNLKRGGSDYTATLLGAAVRAAEIQIWTDIDGMHNNDPRIVKNTFPITSLSYAEAAELAYFGAKILHPSSVWPAKKYNIPLKLLNTLQPEAPGTYISAKTDAGTIKAVAAKDNITAIRIKSGRMLLAYGFLKKVFEIFEKYQTPIDMITTSEVAVSLTIDNMEHLKNIEEELKKYGEVSVDQRQTIVCIVGNMVAEENGIVKSVFNALENIPIRMISYGGSKHNISLLVNSNHKAEALLSLNKNLFHL